MDINSFALGYSAGKKKGGGGVELNIAYGDTPPDDTSKLWVKTAEPNGVLISPEVEETEVDGESYYTMKVTLPYPVAYAGCGVVGSKIYIIGGFEYDGTGSVASKSVIVYDTETGTFEELKDVLGEGIVAIKCAVVGTRIYFIGGGAKATTTSNKIRYFDTVTKELVVCNSQMPTALYGFSCEAAENKIYIFGGVTGSSYKQTAYCYDADNDTYATLGEVYYIIRGNTIRKGNKIYFFGDENGPSYVRCYDIDENSMVSKNISYYVDGKSVSYTGCAGGCFGDYIYLIGGRQSNVISRFDLNTINDYSPKAEQIPFTTHQMIGYSACATIGNKIYIFGGSNSGSSTISPIDEVNVYSLTTNAPSIEEGSLYVKPQTENNIFTLVKAGSFEVEIGVDSVYKGNAEGIGEPVEAALYNGNEWQTI